MAWRHNLALGLALGRDRGLIAGVAARGRDRVALGGQAARASASISTRKDGWMSALTSTNVAAGRMFRKHLAVERRGTGLAEAAMSVT